VKAQVSDEIIDRAADVTIAPQPWSVQMNVPQLCCDVLVDPRLRFGRSVAQSLKFLSLS